MNLYYFIDKVFQFEMKPFMALGTDNSKITYLLLPK